MTFYFKEAWQPQKDDRLFAVVNVTRIVDKKIDWSKEIKFTTICQPDLK